MKLNRKGYMLVEIIISAVLAMSIALYLLNLTYDFKNKNEDIYQSITYTSDKIAITKNIMNDLDKVMITNFKSIDTNDSKNIMIEFYVKEKELSSADELRRLRIQQNEDGAQVITYGKVDLNKNDFIITDVSYYQKTLEKSLIVDANKIKIVDEENNEIDPSTEAFKYIQYIKIIIPVQSLYEDRNYDIKLLLNKNKNTKLNGSFQVVYHINSGNRGTMSESTHFYNITSTLNENQYAKEFVISFNDSYTDCYTDTVTDEMYETCVEEYGDFDCVIFSPKFYSSQYLYQYTTKTVEFKGWSNEENGEVLFRDEESITITDKLEDDTLDLYAIWGEIPSITLPVAQTPVENYSFSGWCYDANKDDECSDDEMIGNSGDTWAPTDEEIPKGEPIYPERFNSNQRMENVIRIRANYIDKTGGIGPFC